MKTFSNIHGTFQKRYQNYRRHIALMNRCIASWSPVPLCWCSLLPAKLRIIYMPHQRANLSFMIGYQLTRMLSKKSIVAGILRKRLVCYKIKPHHLLRWFRANHSNNYHTHFLFVSNLSFLKIYERQCHHPFSMGKSFRSQTLAKVL